MGEFRRIIGIDPGSVITGYGIVDTDGHEIRHVAHGRIRGGKADFTVRLHKIYVELLAVIDQWTPAQAALEDVYVGGHPQSALKLGQARGAAIIAATLSGMKVSSYPPSTVKQAVSGNGSASKEELQKMVRALLKIREPIQVDAGDALAIAICHANSKQTTENMPVAPRRQRRSKGRGLRI